MERGIPRNEQFVDREEEDFELIGEQINSTCSQEEWQSKYGENPTAFFSPENIKELNNLSRAERLSLFTQATKYLENTPLDADRYFKIFSQDLQAIITLCHDKEGRAETGLDIFLFSLSAPAMCKQEPGLAQRYPNFQQYVEMAERRNHAPEILLGQTPGGQFKKIFGEFGKAAEGLAKVLDEAEDLQRYGNRAINPEQIFTEAYNKLNEQQKANFLRKSIAQLQFSLVFHETFNSYFTTERVEEHRQQALKRERPDNAWLLAHPSYEVVHSMLFKTYQPAPVFEFDQKYYERIMNSTADTGGDIEEYAYQRLLLAVLAKIKDVHTEQDQNTDQVTDFWIKNRNPIFGKAIADVLSAQNPNRAASILLKQLRQEKRDKNYLTAILYRLEFGKVGISEEGVRYLEKMYDLREYNNPDFFAQRLTSNGQVGVFDENRKLIKYFNLEGLDSEETRLKTQVLDFTYQTLFTTKKDETPQERTLREEALKEFQENYFGFYNDEFFKETGVRFNNLSFKEQGQLLLFYKHASKEDQGRVFAHVRTYGEDGFRAFLSLEYGNEMGNVILTIGEQLEYNTAERILGKYSDIVDATENIREYIKRNWGDDHSYSKNVEDQIVEGLLKRGKDLLSRFADYTKRAEQGTKSKDAHTREIIKQLNAIKIDILLFANTFKVAAAEKQITFEDIKRTEMASRAATELTKDERAEMENIFRANRPGYSQKLLAATIKEFKEALHNKSAEFHLLKHRKELIAFIRFETLPNGHRYAGSLNVRPEVRGSSIGSAMLKTTLDREAQIHTIEAVVYEKNPMLKHYIGDFGFRIVGEIPDYQNTGEKYFKLERPKTQKMEERLAA